MKYIFNIDYKTVYGEYVYLNIEGREKKRLRMGTVNGQRWTYELSDKQATGQLSYFYSVEHDGMPWQRNGHGCRTS